MGKRRKKPGVSRQVFKRNKSFITQNMISDDMETATLAGKLLRHSIKPMLERAKDATTHGRLTGKMYRVLEKDLVNEKGQRQVHNGDLNLLQGWEFNNSSSFHTVFRVTHTTNLNRANGYSTLSIPSFIPKNSITAPASATHFKILYGVVEANFGEGTSVQQIAESAYLPLDINALNAFEFTCSFTPSSALPIFEVAGIQFFQEVNGSFYEFNDRRFNPLTILKVNV